MVYFNLYYYKKWWYKALTILMILALIVIITVVPIQRAKAIGVLTATMGAAILAVLAGAGVYTVVSGMTWNEISDWLTTRLNAWDTYRNDGYTWDELLLNNKVGATISGFLKIEYELASNICKFVNWLIHTDINLSNNTITEIISETTLFDNIPCAYLSSFSSSEENNNNNPEKIYVNHIYQDNYKSFFVFMCGDSSSNMFPCFLISDEDKGNLIMSKNDGTTVTLTTYTTNNGWWFYNGHYPIAPFSPSIPYSGLTYSEWIDMVININNPNLENTGSLSLGSDVIGIPDVDTDSSDIIINPGAYPGATTEQVTDVIIDGVVENTLDVNMEVTNEFVDAQAVVVTNTMPITVNTDHHLFGFTLPSFDVNFVSIWHYVHDAITYSSGYIAHFVGMLNSIPVLAIPLYMSFTLMIVLGFIRKVL